MNLQEAIETIKFHAIDPLGANLKMRRGENPGMPSLKGLVDALSCVFGETAHQNELRRDIAHYCGTFLQFKRDHRIMMKKLPESEYDELILTLIKVSEKAYDVLSGLYAGQ